MDITFNGLNISIAVPVAIAIIGLIKWCIGRRDKKKNAPKKLRRQA